jgi:putative PIN family toxin of toxin-antitoxin system
VSRRIPIVDTNVLVAGLLTADGSSPVARVLDGMVSASFSFVLSEALLGEYRTVLLRPSISRRHGLSVDEIEAVLVQLAQHAIVIRPSSHDAPQAPDPGDQFLWDLLAERSEFILVTGDKRLLDDAGMAGRVVSPRAFLNDP